MQGYIKNSETNKIMLIVLNVVFQYNKDSVSKNIYRGTATNSGHKGDEIVHCHRILHIHFPDVQPLCSAYNRSKNKLRVSSL